MSGERTDVVLALLRDEAGRVLIARRPSSVHLGGVWEFPGGKVEAGESLLAALRRELMEELAITPLQQRRLMSYDYDYPDRRLRLHVWLVEQWQGALAAAEVGCDDQPLLWLSLAMRDQYPFPEANEAIFAALTLPPLLQITPEPGEEEGWDLFLQQLEWTLESGVRLVQLRSKILDSQRYGQLAGKMLPLMRTVGGRLMLSGTVAEVIAWGGDGLHLDSRALQQGFESEPPSSLLLSASCHHEGDLSRAAALGVSYGLLSPVKATKSHPDSEPLGWENFSRLAASAPFPIYALGGMGRADLEDAWAAGGHGVAAIRSMWLESAPNSP
ncbi:MAG: Nudix family hydrolase [Gammaproteobacteria bacterium]|nr:Nudix family hydrolase [Gammaproteobacteria bacterium]